MAGEALALQNTWCIALMRHNMCMHRVLAPLPRASRQFFLFFLSDSRQHQVVEVGCQMVGPGILQKRIPTLYARIPQK